MWKVLNVGFWVLSLVVAMAFCLVTGPNLILAPMAIGIGMAVGTSARRLSSWTCPRCAAELHEPEPGTAVIAPAAVAPVEAYR